MIKVVKLAIIKFANSVVFITGSVFYNFSILYFSSSFKDSNFLYFNTVIITALSTFYTIENIFQYHYGRVLFSFLRKNANQIDTENLCSENQISISDLSSVVKFFYLFITIILTLVLSIFYFFFPGYSEVISIYILIGIMNVSSGFYSVQLVSLDRVKIQHLITGSVKLFSVILSFMMVFYINGVYYLFYLGLLFSSLIQLILLRKRCLNNIIKDRNRLRLCSSKQIFFKISHPPLKQSVTILVGLVILKIYILVGNKYISKDILNSLYLIQSIFSLTLFFGAMYSVLNMNYFSSGDKASRLIIYKRSLIFSLLIYFIGVSLLFFFNSYLIQLFNYKTLPINFLIILSIIYFFETIFGIAATLYLYLQKVVYFKSSLLTAVLLLLAYTVIYLCYDNFDPIILMLIPLIFQLFYNYWYYPIKLYFELK